MSSRSPRDWTRARNRLGELNALIDALTTERKLLQAELDSIVYPVLTLPPEITSLIFVQSLPEDPAPSTDTAPLLVTWICQQWRAIALATPRLWQSIYLGPRREPNAWRKTIAKKPNDAEKLLSLWLARSASLPLSLSLGSSEVAQTQSLIDTVMLHCDRWQEIEMFSEAPNLDAAQRSFPILREVKLSSFSQNPPAIAILDAPALRAATIAVGPDQALARVQLPWAQLTTLTIQTFELTTSTPFSDMLSRCTQLHSLKQHSRLSMDVETPTYSTPHITVGTVRYLHIDSHSYSIVPYLTLPGLQRLTVSTTIASAIEPFRALMTRSSFQLQELTITINSRSYEEATPEELRLFYRIFPTVTQLKLMLLGERELHHMVSSLSPSNILPSLEVLTIVAVRVRDEYGPLLDVLRARCSTDSGTAALKSFHLTLRPRRLHSKSPPPSRPLPELAMAQFDALEKSGLKCRIKLT